MLPGISVATLPLVRRKVPIAKAAGGLSVADDASGSDPPQTAADWICLEVDFSCRW